MQTTESRKFFIYPLPLVKGICILSVILIHVTTDSAGMKQSQWLTSSFVFVNCFTRFAVPLFVALSGLYLSLNPRNECAVPFYRHTLKFLIVPYVIYSLIYSMPAFRKNGKLLEVVQNLLTASASPHLWFGLLILQLYLLHPFLSRWYRARKHHGTVVISAFLVQIVWSLSLAILFQDPDPLRAGTGILERLGSLVFVSNIGYFLGGYYMLEHADEAVRLLRHTKVVYAGAIGWLSTAIGLFLYWGIPISQGISNAATLRTYLAHSVFVPLLSFAVFVSVFPFVQNRNPSQTVFWRILHSLGLYSYGIYYFHGLSGWLLSWTIRSSIAIGYDNALFRLLLFPLTTLLTLLSVRFLSRSPFGKYVT